MTSLLAGLVFFSPLFILPGIADLANLAKAVFLQIGCCILLVLWTWSLRQKSNEGFRFKNTDFIILAWILWSGITLIWTPGKYTGLYVWTQWLSSVGICLVARHLILTPLTLRKFLLLFFVSGVSVALIGILQFLVPDTVRWIGDPNKFGSTFLNKSMAIEYVLLTFPLGFIFFLKEEIRAKEWRYALGITAISIFLTYALSRSGLLFSFLQVTILLGFLSRKKWRETLLQGGWTRRKTIILFSCLLILFVFANLTRSGFKWRWEKGIKRFEQTQNELLTVSTNSSEGSRITLWKNTLAMIKDDPWVGRGIGSYKSIYPEYATKTAPDPNFTFDEQPAHAHNDYLQIWAEQGIIGIILTLGLFISFLLLAWKGLKRKDDASGFHLGMMLGMIGILCDALVSFPMDKAIPPFVILFYLSMMIGVDPDARTVFVPKRLATALALLSVILLWQTVAWNLTRLSADKHYMNATQAGEKKNWPKMLYESKVAHDLRPHHIRSHFLLARAYAATGQHAKAIATYQEALVSHPGSINEIWNMGSSYLDLGRVNEALTYYYKAISLMPNEGSLHFYVANLYKKIGDTEKSEAEFKKAYELNPSLVYTP